MNRPAAFCALALAWTGEVWASGFHPSELMAQALQWINGLGPAGALMYVYIGSLAGSLASLGSASAATHSELQWALRIVGLIATVAVTVYVTRIARRALVERIE